MYEKFKKVEPCGKREKNEAKKRSWGGWKVAVLHT